jgi:cytochrome c-type biogenesis protein CcmE
MLLLVLSTAIIFLVLKSLEDNVVYFFSPTEVYDKSSIALDTKMRIGGLVKEGSTVKKEQNINFVITDLKNEIVVTYRGIIPNLFSEGKGVIAEGKLKDKKYFIADKILAKHDENYMPPEVSDALSKTK